MKKKEVLIIFVLGILVTLLSLFVNSLITIVGRDRGFPYGFYGSVQHCLMKFPSQCERATHLFFPLVFIINLLFWLIVVLLGWLMKGHFYKTRGDPSLVFFKENKQIIILLIFFILTSPAYIRFLYHVYLKLPWTFFLSLSKHYLKLIN